MSVKVDLRIVELLAARLCHELIGPVAAISNGVELLADEEPDFVRDAVALVGDSARKASRRLQFYRFAYGVSSGGLAGPPPYDLAAALFEGTRVTLDFDESARGLPLERQKLACNLLLVGVEGLPRGGRLMLTVGAAGLAVAGAGAGAALSSEARAALGLDTAVGEVTSRTVGAYFAGVLAASLGLRLVPEATEPGRFHIAAVTRG